MKLNKVMALALSGLMAISMLAGCAGDPNGGDNGEQPPVADTTVAGQLNDKLTEMNLDEYVTFSYSNDVQNAAEQVARVNGGLTTGLVDAWDTEEANAKALVMKYLGVDDSDVVALTALGNNQNPNVVGTQYAISAKAYKGITAEEARKQAVKTMADWIKTANLEISEEVNDLKYSFTYTGEIAMVSDVDNGVPVYCVIAVIKCDTAAPVKA